MSDNQTQGFIARKTLSETELSEIKQLVDICNRYEGLHMRLFFDLLQRPSDNETNDFLYYEDRSVWGTDGKLVGYIHLYEDGSDARELIAMVHPDYRRKGIFRRLLEEVKAACQQKGVQKLVLTCERSSTSGQACVKAIGAQLDFSEHEMVLGTFHERFAFDERLFFQRASTDDLNAIAAILATGMNDNEEAVRQHVLEIAQRPNEHFYLATFGEEQVGCREPVGTLRLFDMQDRIGIYGFVVLPDYRGRGYGRQMLEEAIRMIHEQSQKEIMLDVDVNNTNALNLYLSCGFEIQTTYDYYVLEIV